MFLVGRNDDLKPMTSMMYSHTHKYSNSESLCESLYYFVYVQTLQHYFSCYSLFNNIFFFSVPTADASMMTGDLVWLPCCNQCPSLIPS